MICVWLQSYGSDGLFWVNFCPFTLLGGGGGGLKIKFKKKTDTIILHHCTNNYHIMYVWEFGMD